MDKLCFGCLDERIKTVGFGTPTLVQTEAKLGTTHTVI